MGEGKEGKRTDINSCMVPSAGTQMILVNHAIEATMSHSSIYLSDVSDMTT